MAGEFSVIQVGPLPPLAVAMLQQHFNVIQWNETDKSKVVQKALGTVQGLATTGKAPVDRVLMDRFPHLRIIACLGAGADGIDAEWAARRGIAITTTSEVLAADVADVAMGLIITLARDFQGAGNFVQSGQWSEGRYRLGIALAGSRLGIVGLGNIGNALARRAAIFGMEIGYHTRRMRPGSPFHFFAGLTEMARWSRFLAVCCPGGAETEHLVGSDVLNALGAEGYLINVARGSIVDEAVLASALRKGTIAGAGLDVFEAEPYPEPSLLDSPRAVLLPHIGSATHETRTAMAKAMVQSLRTALMSPAEPEFR